MSEFIEIGNSIFNKGEISSILKTMELNHDKEVEYGLTIILGDYEVPLIFQSKEDRDNEYEEIIELLDVFYFEDMLEEDAQSEND